LAAVHALIFFEFRVTRIRPLTARISFLYLIEYHFVFISSVNTCIVFERHAFRYRPSSFLRRNSKRSENYQKKTTVRLSKYSSGIFTVFLFLNSSKRDASLDVYDISTTIVVFVDCNKLSELFFEHDRSSSLSNPK